MHSDEKKSRKDSPEISEPARAAAVSVRLELMRYPNIRKLKSERLDTLAMEILIALEALGALTIDLGTKKRTEEPAPERKLREVESGPKRG